MTGISMKTLLYKPLNCIFICSIYCEFDTGRRIWEPHATEIWGVWGFVFGFLFGVVVFGFFFF